ncbi:hypothetical protein NliqN6_1324 [Naganishia liquefaciens]|uniref:Uncharacterized protein n=1 Tax=Naganishia liquefaciens TaxID=104408 RepID=A0A8H3TPP4_9TREE|nr:hypothetical protein NliqN6_1324 [Naganishia liquefaciens]
MQERNDDQSNHCPTPSSISETEYPGYGSWSEEEPGERQQSPAFSDGNDYRGTPQFSPNSPPFAPMCHLKSDECHEYNRGTSITCDPHPIPSGETADDPPDISDSEELPQDSNRVVPEDVVAISYGTNAKLYIPRTADEAKALIHQFREEILHEWIADDRIHLRLHDEFDAHQLDMADLGIALQSDNKIGGKLFVEQANIARHDWIEVHGQLSCVYSIDVSGCRYRCSAELFIISKPASDARYGNIGKRHRALILHISEHMSRASTLLATSASLCGTY